MNYLTQEEAAKILSPYHQVIVDCWQSAIDEWKEIASKHRNTCPRLRADFINDRCREKIIETLPSHMLKVKPGSVQFLPENLACRFKKLTNSRPSNIQTQEVMKLEAQDTPLLGKVFKGRTIVNIGYVPNRFWSSFKFEVSCIYKRKVLWSYIIPVEASIVAIAPPVDVVQPPKKKRIQIKKAQ